MVRSVYYPPASVAGIMAAAFLSFSCGEPPLTVDPGDPYQLVVEYAMVTVTALAVDSDGNAWIGAGDGLHVIVPNGARFWLGGSGGLGGESPRDITVDGSGLVLMTTGERIICFDDNGTPTSTADDRWISLGSGDWSRIAVDDSGVPWVATYSNPFGSGIACVDIADTPFDPADDSWTSFESADGLPADGARRVAAKLGGGYWIVTGTGPGLVLSSGQLAHLDDGGTPASKSDDTWSTLYLGDGLLGHRITAVAVAGGGRVWFGSSGEEPCGVSFFDNSGTAADKSDDRWRQFTGADGLSASSVDDIVLDGNGIVWIGTNGGGLNSLDDNGTPFDTSDDKWMAYPQSGSSVRSMITGGNSLWLATNGGAVYFHGSDTPSVTSDDVWITRTMSDGLSSNDLQCLVSEDSRTRWFGTWGGGVCRLDDYGTPGLTGDDLWITYDTGNSDIAGNTVLCVAVDPAGGKWFGTNGSGLSYLDDRGTPEIRGDDLWITYRQQDGLPFDTVYRVIPDGDDCLWIATGGQLCRLDHNGTPLDKSDDTYELFPVYGVLDIQFFGDEQLWAGTWNGAANLY